MPKNKYGELLQNVIEQLSSTSIEEKSVLHARDVVPPSRETLERILDVIKSVLFPAFFGSDYANGIRNYFVGVNVDLIYSLLKGQFTRALQYDSGSDTTDVDLQAEDLTASFIKSLPEIKRLLYTDVQAIYKNDPAVDNYSEVISCYPVVQAMVHYRVAHRLVELGLPVIPRIITELAHSATGIDIHPGATIGEHFAIDHGTGVVIGETCIIGNHVTLYQGVTLGAKNFSLDTEGHPLNIPRHPILEDHVTVYSNSTILGRVTIGHHSVIGGNVWLTHDVQPHSHILQGKAISTPFTDGLGI